MSMFVSIDYRNCRYQGQCLDTHQPHGEGILLDDELRFILGTWARGNLNGNSLIFDSHSKYIYGPWRSGVPQGINVYRGGETIMLANFENGQIVGQFLVVFESQGLILAAQILRGESVIVKKSEGADQKDIQQAAKEIGFNDNIEELISLIRFVERSYGSSVSGIQVSDYNDLHYLGIKDGLGILFDDYNFIHKVGHISKDMEVVSIGGAYTSSGSKQGNFEDQQIVSYKDERPTEQLKAILKEAHLKSIVFKNQYLLTKVPAVFEYISEVLKHQIISKLAQDQLQESRRFNIQDINDSLGYHPKDQSENQRLKKMRAELYLALGKPGTEIKPIKKEIIDQFLADEQQHKNEKYQPYSKYNGSGHGNYGFYDTSYRPPTARFQMVDYRRRSSPVRIDRSRSPAAYQPMSIKTDKGTLTWFQRGSMNLEASKNSRSPFKHKTEIVTSEIAPVPTVASQSTATFGNKPATGSVRYDDIKQRRARLLNQYQCMGNRSSPPKLSPIKSSEPTLYGSPASRFESSKFDIRNSGKQGSDSKTLSRRLDKSEALPSRSPQRYSYLDSFL